MKALPQIAATLLGLAFVAFGLLFFFGPPPPAMPPDSLPEIFFRAMGPTGYMAFVKVLEILGGLLLIIPKSRSLGLLTLGPIIVNILAFHIFITKGGGLTDPPLIIICLIAVFVLWTERKRFSGLLS